MPVFFCLLSAYKGLKRETEDYNEAWNWRLLSAYKGLKQLKKANIFKLLMEVY